MRKAAAGFLLVCGIMFTLICLALMGLMFMIFYNRADTKQTAAVFPILLPSAIIAVTITNGAIFLRGWRVARAGYYCLACLFGFPIIAGLVILIRAL